MADRTVLRSHPMNHLERWKRYQQYLCESPTIGLRLDISRMNFDEAYLERMHAPMAAARSEEHTSELQSH